MRELPTLGVGAMGDQEVRDFIQKSKVGVLCLVDGDKPYAVPLEHFYRNGNLYFVVSSKDDSRKLNCIKRNNNVCYVIYESRRENSKLVEENRMCRSLILEGTIALDKIKEIDLGTKKAKIQILKMDIVNIGNWICPLEKCDMKPHILERKPELLEA